MARSPRRNDPALPFPASSPDPAEPVPISALLAHVTDFVAVVDAKGEIRAISGSVERRLGHRPERLIGSQVSQLFVADHDEVPPEVLDRVFLARGSHGPVQLLALDADGRPRQVEAMIENRLEWSGDDRGGGHGRPRRAGGPSDRPSSRTAFPRRIRVGVCDSVMTMWFQYSKRVVSVRGR